MKSYLITDPAYYGSKPEELSRSLETALQSHKVDFALFRDKSTPIYPDLARTFVSVCRRYGVGKVMLHGEPLTAYRLKADGVHLGSHQHLMIEEAKSLGLYVIISTHTRLEALVAQEAGADAITYSPIFDSPGKGEPKGLEDLKEIVDTINVPIFALGGIISDEQIYAVTAAGAYGFASIRYFVS
ncbi:MAG: thiamine phosphate synthase [Campylobacterales bacterium]|nr:thiamine phosphate synthase [Campylobacterales bacterium]